MLKEKRDKLKSNLKAQVSYVREFFRRDEKNYHVHYVSFLSNPILYVVAFVAAIILYIDYLYTDHFDVVSEVVAQIPDLISKALNCAAICIFDFGEWLNTTCNISAVAVVLTLLLFGIAYKFLLNDRIFESKKTKADELENVTFDPTIHCEENFNERSLGLSGQQSSDQMKQATKEGIAQLMNSEQFKKMAKAKGMSTETYQKKHWALFERDERRSSSPKRSAPVTRG